MKTETAVGVRELRQNLSKYLRLVARGESLRVTDHGREVAMLGPLPPKTESVMDRLVREGRAIRATGDIRDLPAPLGPVSTRGTDALEELREERL